ncbi:MAG: LD-carboxypeptidase [Thermoproteota archaeon]|nr:MAG: LD-carboxypeptidase [Candidatus Korarchaeota archaeon]
MSFWREMIKPPRLRKGGKIGIVCPAGGADLVAIKRGMDELRKLGYDVVPGRNLKKLAKTGFFSAKAKDRAIELMNMFEDEEIGAIISSRGGYGCMELLNQLDYEAIKENSKPFVGFSDITALLIAFNQLSNLITFHGPMIGDLLWIEKPEQAKKNLENLLNVISNPEPIGEIKNPSGAPYIQTIGDGIARGALIGGNLTLISSLMGTPYQVKVLNKIVLIEDVDEPPYRVHRYLTQLELGGIIEEASGFIVGEFTNTPKRPGPSIEEVLREKLSNKPSIYGLACGHGTYRLTLPMGCRAVLDAESRKLIIEEEAVS